MMSTLKKAAVLGSFSLALASSSPGAEETCSGETCAAAQVELEDSDEGLNLLQAAVRPVNKDQSYAKPLTLTKIQLKERQWKGPPASVQMQTQEPQAALLQQKASLKSRTMRPASDSEKKAFLDTHNLRRCMHGAPPVTWNDDVAASGEEYIAPMTTMKHADSYSIPPPAGPAGENLAMSSGALGARKATEMWYSEVDYCTGGANFDDGCPYGTDGEATGHFTSMIWKGVKEIGCAFSDGTSPTLVICRYKAGDSLSNDTPNMNKPANYVNQVLPATVSLEECVGITGAPAPPTPAPTPPPAPPPAANPMDGSPDCKDSPTYTDSHFKMGCADWAQYTCTGYSDDDEKLRQCPKACKKCSPCKDSTTYKDPIFGMGCSDWKSYTCTGYAATAEMQKECPNGCKACDL